MDTQKFPVPEWISTWVLQWVSKEKISPPSRIELLAGDGSVRSFYRLYWQDRTRVLLADPEWKFSQDYAPLQQFLASHQIPVPKFYIVDPKAGCLVMEDLGDELLQTRIKKKSKDKNLLLKDAVILLAHLHGRTFPTPSHLPATQRLFDAAKYFEELSFTFQHLGQVLLKLPEMTAPDKLRSFCKLLEEIQPYVFCHRDYHSRNILIKEDHLYLIDFQDARMGPPQYDLASLIYDAYTPIDPTERALFCSLYLENLKSYPLYKELQLDKFDKHLELIALQRLIKASGSFASFYTRFGKTTHLKYIRPALSSAQSLTNSTPSSDCFPIEQWLRTLESRGIT